MNTVLTLLAAAGIATAAWHLVRAAVRFLRHAAAGVWADEMAQTHAQRGDLTSLEEREEDRVRATRAGARYGIEALGWLALLAVPSLTAWARPLYAAYSLLLLEPAVRRLRA